MDVSLRTVESRSPQSPADIVASVDAADAAAVCEAAKVARHAQQEWARVPPGERAQRLHAVADAVAANASELAALVVREVGKPLAESRGEVARSVAILRYFAQQAFDPAGAVHESSAGIGLSYTRRRPRGVVGLITPWNFPLAIPLWKAAPAIAFGNAVLLKPAPQATACASRLATLLADCLPAELVQILTGDAETGAALIDCADVVSFTGSVAVGQQVAVRAASLGRHFQCEMGGQNPAVVLADADAEAAARQIASAAFGFAGQKCTATKRIVVVGDVRTFTDALVAATQAMKVGDPADDETAIGPVIDDAARDKVRLAAADVEAAGGQLPLGAGECDRDEGWFVEPILATHLPADHPLLREEVFGPICALIAVPTTAEALQVANDVRYGLTAAVYTTDLDAALHFAGGLEAGQVKVNAPTTGVDFYLPFGGEKDSSAGPREQGKSAQEFYTCMRTVTIAAGHP